MKKFKKISLITVIIIAALFAGYLLIQTFFLPRNSPQKEAVVILLLAKTDRFLCQRQWQETRIPVLKMLIRLNDTPVNRAALGQAYFYTGHLKEAKKEILSAIAEEQNARSNNPNRQLGNILDSHVLLAEIYYNESNNKLAIEELKTINTLLKDRHDPQEQFVVLGMILVALEEDESLDPEANLKLRKRTSVPKDIKSQFDKFQDDFKKGRYDSAREELTTLLGMLEKEKGKYIRNTINKR